MAGRNRNTVKIETTIENCRSEAKWSRVIELADELKIGSPNYGNFSSYTIFNLSGNNHKLYYYLECLSNFLIGEGKLESFLEENAPVEANYAKAKGGLVDAKNFLNLVTGESGKKAGIALDAHLLLAKLFYACGQHSESLEHFNKAELTTLSEKELTLRSLRILAESYAIKGLCLEKDGPKGSSRFKLAERETEMITCFERAADLGLLYLQDQDIGSMSQTDPRRMGAILETALQRAPIVLIKFNKLQPAIERYRTMLTAVETKATQTLRLTLARQLAEVLLRGVSGTIYTSPSVTSNRSQVTNSRRPWKPRKYSGRNQFVPKNQQEETILLLLISEALAVRDAVLSQSPEFRLARSHALGNATAVYDLLTLATVRWGQMSHLHESFEKALKFSFGEQHVWRQYALSLTSLGRHAHAVRALQESSKLVPHDPLPCLLSARTCYEHLGQYKEGLDYALQALKKETKGLRPSRAQLYVGIGYQQYSINSNLKSDRDKYGKMALEAFEKAVQLDPNDHLAEYYLALQYALNFNIPEALNHIRVALMLRTEHANSLHLFALLLTANRRPKEALYVVEDALREFPDNINLLHVKAHLDLHLQDADTALYSVQRMLSIWRDLYELQVNGVNDNDMERHSDTKSVIQFHSSQISDRDSSKYISKKKSL